MNTLLALILALTIAQHAAPAPRTTIINPQNVKELIFSTICYEGANHLGLIRLELVMAMKNHTRIIRTFDTEYSAWNFATAPRFYGKWLTWNGDHLKINKNLRSKFWQLDPILCPM